MSGHQPINATEMILEPPGSIVVVGGGGLGIEAALYGRYLGYDVTVLEAERVARRAREAGDDPLPMLPDRSFSSLAAGALLAHRGTASPRPLPTTCAGWADEIIAELADTDLLAGRVREQARVHRIEHDVADDEDVPPDFLVHVGRDDHPVPAEAVIVATGSEMEIGLGFEPPAAYFFRIGEGVSDDAEADYAIGLKQIVAIFAKLGDRAELDLHRPRRGLG